MPDFRRTLRHLDALRHQFHGDVGQHARNWEFDARTAGSLQAYQQVLRVWHESLQEMARIIHTLEENRHQP